MNDGPRGGWADALADEDLSGHLQSLSDRRLLDTVQDHTGYYATAEGPAPSPSPTRSAVASSTTRSGVAVWGGLQDNGVSLSAPTGSTYSYTYPNTTTPVVARPIHQERDGGTWGATPRAVPNRTRRRNTGGPSASRSSRSLYARHLTNRHRWQRRELRRCAPTI
jgi:hypothetical protein